MHNYILNIQVEDGHQQWFADNPLDYLRETRQLNFVYLGYFDGQKEFPYVPPLRPDPALVWQVEGDKKTIDRYRKAAEAAVELANRTKLYDV